MYPQLIPSGNQRIHDGWSDDYRVWLRDVHGLQSRWTIQGYVACARTYLIYQADTEGLTFRDWLIKHKRSPKTAAVTESAVKRFRMYLDTHDVKAN